MIIERMSHEVEANAPFEIVVRHKDAIRDCEARYRHDSRSEWHDIPRESIVLGDGKRVFRVTNFAFQEVGVTWLDLTFRFRGDREVPLQIPVDVLAAATPQGIPPSPAPTSGNGATHGPANGRANGSEPRPVALFQPSPEFTSKDRRWAAIFTMSQNVSYAKYEEFISQVLCGCEGNDAMCRELGKLCAVEQPTIHDLGRFYGTYGYEDLKTATEVFLLCHAHRSCKDAEELEPRLKYAGAAEEKFRKFKGLLSETGAGDSLLEKSYAFLASQNSPTPFCADDDGGDSGLKLRCTDDMFLEYIWTFYHDIGMLEQTMKAISLRFQNKRSTLLKNQLDDLEISHLRPLTDLLWGYINDEAHRLSVPRRALEYEHQYGLAVTGKATQGVRSIDRRSEFLSAFHTLLLRCHAFFIETSNLTIKADPFPVQNALRDLYKILFDGAHNQFSRATFSSRAEFLIGQWLLARPEMRLFLRGREMTPYAEKWMAPVDAMRRLQGWGEDSVATYRDLAVLGERLLLSIRFGGWNDDNITEAEVTNWALSFKEDIQLYCHGYRAVTGIDLTQTGKFDASQPVPLIEARQKSLRAAG